VAELSSRLESVEKDLAAQRSSRQPEDRTLQRRVEALEEQLASATAALDAARRATTVSPAAASSAPASGKAADAKPADAATKSEAAAIADALKSSKPGSPEHLDALRKLADWLVRFAGPPPVEAEIAWAEGLVNGEGRRGRITVAEAAELMPQLDSAAPGSAARPGLAIAVGAGFAKDARLASLLDRFTANTEPAVHDRLLSLLDHTPSAAFSGYVLRMIREEKDRAVLSNVLDVDRIQAATTNDNALRFAEALEARLGDRALADRNRSRAMRAIGIAGLRTPQACAEILERVAERETDAALAEKCRSAAASLTAGNSSVNSLENTFGK
jgi:hypothetical protein